MSSRNNPKFIKTPSQKAVAQRVGTQKTPLRKFGWLAIPVIAVSALAIYLSMNKNSLLRNKSISADSPTGDRSMPSEVDASELDRMILQSQNFGKPDAEKITEQQIQAMKFTREIRANIDQFRTGSQDRVATARQQIEKLKQLYTSQSIGKKHYASMLGFLLDEAYPDPKERVQHLGEIQSIYKELILENSAIPAEARSKFYNLINKQEALAKSVAGKSQISANDSAMYESLKAEQQALMKQIAQAQIDQNESAQATLLAKNPEINKYLNQFKARNAQIKASQPPIAFNPPADNPSSIVPNDLNQLGIHPADTALGNRDPANSEVSAPPLAGEQPSSPAVQMQTIQSQKPVEHSRQKPSAAELRQAEQQLKLPPVPKGDEVIEQTTERTYE